MKINEENYIANSMEPETKSLEEIIYSFLNGFKRLWWISLILAIGVGFYGYAEYRNHYVAMYESRATFSITAPEYNGQNDESYTNNSQLASVLSVSFGYLINNEVFYEIIKKDINLDYLPSTINISAVEDTNILSIVTTGSDAELNYKVIESVINNYSSVVEFVLGDTEITILEEPTLSLTPINPYSPWHDSIFYGIIGIFIGMIPSVLYAFFVKTIKSKEEVEKYLNIPCFGLLPVVNLGKKDKVCSIINKSVGFRYLEAVRVAVSRCERILKKRDYKVILITSTKEGEGKSTFAMNLAYSLSKLQNRVMLIDGNLRDPSLREMTGADMVDYSMEQFMEKKLKNSEAIVNLPGTRVLLLAPNIPSKNSIKCLNSDAMEHFIEEAREVVDYIIIDAPHCGDTSDAAVLAKYSDGVVYVVKEDDTRVHKILNTIQEFSYTRTPMIGCVLNGSTGKLKISYGYGYGRHYGYGKYGYGRYGYGRYGYGGYGYGYGSYGYNEYGKVSDEEFSVKEKQVSKKISMTTTEEEKRALEREKELKRVEDQLRKAEEQMKELKDMKREFSKKRKWFQK